MTREEMLAKLAHLPDVTVEPKGVWVPDPEHRRAEISAEDAHMMMNGGRPEGCICEMTDDVRHYYGSPPEPACWAIRLVCPRHSVAQKEDR